MTIELDKLFAPQNKSVLDFFRVAGVGYLIPEYQREYSWDNENIDQLLKDVSMGVERLTDKNFSDNEIRFLGTVITVTDKENKNLDPKGTPTRIDMIIDGQQRVITLSIVASLFIKRLYTLSQMFDSSSDIYQDVNETIKFWYKKLIEFICFDLTIGEPQLKPRIVRGGMDFWTAYENIENAYISDIAAYQAKFINAFLLFNEKSKVEFPTFAPKTVYAHNCKRIEKWLNQVVGEAHRNDNDEYPTAKTIIDNISQSYLWHSDRPKLTEKVAEQFAGNETKETSAICTLVQTISAAYYMLERCCFCVIKPENEDWAFDMFQSLNATGTPLTAFETFKPVVINYCKTSNVEYKGSLTETYFKKIEDFLGDVNTAVQKTKRTNDFIVSYFAAYKGEKVPTHFSGERRALVDSYNSLDTLREKESFIKRMGDYSFFYRLWLDYDGQKTFKLNEVNDEADLASMLILFLKKSNHKMAITTLGTAYSKVLDESAAGDQEFINVVKATAAFYFLWRSAYANNGLDVAYRNFFINCFKNKENFTVEGLKEHFYQILSEKGIKKSNWKQKAAQSLKYSKSNNSNNLFIKLALLIAATDTISDPSLPGSIKKGKEGVSDYLRLKHWLCDDLNTIEHVAPQTNSGTWDSALYDQETMLVNSLGNLTLLPIDLNSSIGNKNFQEKLLYYKCVAEDDQDVLNEIDKIALKLKVKLSDTTVEKLRDCRFQHHMLPISKLDYSDTWKADLVKTRTNAMLDIIYDKLISWLE